MRLETKRHPDFLKTKVKALLPNVVLSCGIKELRLVFNER